MAILSIKSENPNFSYILQKNPSTPMVMKSFRRGVLFGYFDNEGVYHSYFKDGDDEISIRNGSDMNEGFEYNDVNRYNSPLNIIASIKTFFKTAVKETSEYDVEGFKHTITINQINIFQTKYIDILNRYFGNHYEVQLDEMSPNNYRLTISTNKTLREALSFMFCIGVIYYFKTDVGYLNESEVVAFMEILNNINPPYFIKYVIKSNLPTYSNRVFLPIKPLLDKNDNGEKWDIKIGNSHSQRMDFILKEISGNYPIIDLGCGDMRSYGLRLAKLIDKKDFLYHAIDNDVDIIENLEGKIKARDLSNIITYKSFDEFLDIEYPEKFDIIMSEIFEHVELKQDKKWITDIINKIDFNKLIITTPNRDFNKHYLFQDETEKRLDEHVFEMNGEEFQNYFNKLLPKLGKVNWEFVNIGDEINGESITQGVIITKK